MPLMIWDKTLDVGVPAMNDEHRLLIAAMNEIYDAHERRAAGPVLNKLVAELGDLCARHFADEEKFLAAIKFPDLERHKSIHAQLLAQYAKHAALTKSNGGRVSPEFFRFLRLWISTHIQAMDTQYGQYAHEMPKPAR